MVDPINGFTEINLHDLSLLPSLNALLCAYDTYKSASQEPRANLGVGSTPLRSINRPRQTGTRLSNTLDKTDVMEIGRKLATDEAGGLYGFGVSLACLQQAGKFSIFCKRKSLICFKWKVNLGIRVY